VTGTVIVGSWNAVTTDAQATSLYAAEVRSYGSTVVWRVPLPTGGPATMVSTHASTLHALDLDASGDLVFASNAGLGSIDVATGTTATISTTRSSAAVVEAGTGAIATTLAFQIALLSGGTTVPIANPPATSWGVITGIDVLDSLTTYGDDSPGANTYMWAHAPSPGGIPTIGSTSFGLTVEASPGLPAASALWLSLARSTVSVLGVTVLVDLGPGFLASVPIPATATATLPLAITPALAGLTFYAQTVHLENGGVLATSGGLRFSVVTP
jgi:hypothetical protein